MTPQGDDMTQPTKKRKPRRRRPVPTPIDRLSWFVPQLTRCAWCGVLLDHFLVTFAVFNTEDQSSALTCPTCTETVIAKLHGARDTEEAWLEAWWGRVSR